MAQQPAQPPAAAPPSPAVKKAPKSGQRPDRTAQRKMLFADAYVAHGENGTRAAISIGVPEAGAHVQASRWLKEPKVMKLIEKRRAELRSKFSLTTDRVMQELARTSYFQPKRLVDPRGVAIPLHKLDDDTAAALASVKTVQVTVKGHGKNRVVTRKVTESRPYNKVSALEKSIKILRLYDKPPPPPPDEEGHQAERDPRDTGRRLAFLLAEGAAANEEAGEAKPAARRKKLKLTA